MAKRYTRTTAKQFEIMVDFIVNHKEMIHGKLSPSFSASDRDALWNDLTTMLNNDGIGPKKTAQKWRRTWSDLKSEVKIKASDLIKRKTGGGPPVEALSPLYDRVANLIGSLCIEGDRNVMETTRYSPDQHQAADNSVPRVVIATSMSNTDTSQEQQTCPQSEWRELSSTSAISTPLFIKEYNEDMDDPPMGNYDSSQIINTPADDTPADNTPADNTPATNTPLSVPRSSKKSHKKKSDENYLEKLVEAELKKEAAINRLASELNSANCLKEKQLKIQEKQLLMQERKFDYDTQQNETVNQLKMLKVQIEKERNSMLKAMCDAIIKKI